MARYLEPIEKCKCGRAAAFRLCTPYKVSMGYSRSEHWATRMVPKCVPCAEKLLPGIGSKVFSADETATVPEATATA